MADYLVEMDYEARYTIVYKVVAGSPAEAEDAAIEAVGRGDEMPILERRIYMNGGWDVNRHETRPLREMQRNAQSAAESEESATPQDEVARNEGKTQ